MNTVIARSIENVRRLRPTQDLAFVPVTQTLTILHKRTKNTNMRALANRGGINEI
jgi:hypothetical protein